MIFWPSFLIPPAMRSSFQYFLTFSVFFLGHIFLPKDGKRQHQDCHNLERGMILHILTVLLNVLPIFGWTRLATFKARETLGTEPVLGELSSCKNSFSFDRSCQRKQFQSAFVNLSSLCCLQHFL